MCIIQVSASVPLVSFFVEVKGVNVYDCCGLRVCRREHVVLYRQPYNTYDVKCMEVQLQRGRRLLGCLEAAVAARLSPLMHVPVNVAKGITSTHVPLSLKTNGSCSRLKVNVMSVAFCDATTKCIT